MTSHYVIDDNVVRRLAADAQRTGQQDRKAGLRLRLWVVYPDPDRVTGAKPSVRETSSRAAAG